MEILNSHGVKAEPVNNIDEAFADPQVVHNQMKQAVQHPTAGEVNLLRMPLQLSSTPLEIQVRRPGWESTPARCWPVTWASATMSTCNSRKMGSCERNDGHRTR